LTKLISGPPQCLDKRCIDPLAYKYTGTEEIECNIVNCVIDIDSLTAEQQAVVEANLSQDCGISGNGGDTNNNTNQSNSTTDSSTTNVTESSRILGMDAQTAFIVVIVAIVIFFSCIVGSAICFIPRSNSRPPVYKTIQVPQQVQQIPEIVRRRFTN